MQTSARREHKRMPKACKIIYLIGAISLVLYIIFLLSPTFADWFNRYVGQAGRFLLAALTSWIPFSVAELLLLLIPLWFYLILRTGYRHYSHTNRSMLTYFGILLSGLCVIWILFVWNFAAGYYGTALDQKLDLDRRESSAEDLYETALILSDELNACADEIVLLESGSSAMPYSYDEMNDKLLDAYSRFCQRNGFVNNFSSKVKPVMLSEPMSYTHITGVYTFFTGEANININFPDFTIPFTAAHELAHQRGVAREEEANFIAFLICMESDDPYIRYSGALSLYEYVAAALASSDAKLWRDAYRTLPDKVRAEEAAYAAFFDRYRDNVAADISEATNNLYLQSQGNSAGTKSYGLVVDLAVAYYRPAFE